MQSDFVQIFLDEAVDILNEWERHCLAMQAQPNPASCDALFRSAHNLKGSARSVGLDAFARTIHKAEDLITLVRSGASPYTGPIHQLLLAVQSVLVLWRDQLLLDTGYVPEAKLLELEPLFQQLNQDLPGQDSPPSSQAEPQNSAFGFFEGSIETAAPAPLAASTQSQPPLKAPAAKPAPASSHETLRVASAKIDALMQLVGELSTQQATISHYLKNGRMHEPVCRNAVQIAAKITRELQLQTMGLRLVDLSRLFQRLERTAKDLATAQNKKIEIEVEGSEVEMDKAVVDQILDALVHMVRNSVDHGIESPEERGDKPEVARLKLVASQVASGICLEISDDGRGIDPQKVLKKARDLGLVQPGVEPPEEKIYDFLFGAGFSTASQITEVSGRGVGLDVVRQTLEVLGGSVKVTSTLGRGTSFHITLPVNVSIVDSLVILVDQEHYVVPIQEISEVIDVRAHKIQTEQGDSVTIELRKRALTVRHLSSYLPLKSGRSSSQRKVAQADSAPAMIIEINGRRVGFEFDKVVGQHPIMIRKLSPYLANLPGFAGSTILASGEPAVILSPKVFAGRFLALKEQSA